LPKAQFLNFHRCPSRAPAEWLALRANWRRKEKVPSAPNYY